ncbi:unnamed protein product [Enterobius vermicularis]|uniref:Retinol dehydrogenase 12 n=1 Tax=Enterobius vermicularis TaxID=51028 RepID=A0A0N4UXI0_ENTVE|nr:unnamed protein product [Enterobius vermicularis]
MEKKETVKKFSSSSTALEVTEGVDLNGKTVLVTGCTSGIGTETARTLALRNAHVVMANRNQEQSMKLRDRIRAEMPNANIDLLELDLSSLKSVKKAAEEFLAKDWKLHILILNAGVFSPSVKKTVDGFEMAFGVNHLGHFYLTYLLLDRLRQSSPSRVVVVTSVTHKHSGVNPKASTDEKVHRLIEPALSQVSYRLYACSKLCNILMAMKLHRDELKNDIRVYSVHPGTLISTGISRTYGWPGRLFYRITQPFCKTLQQGAATTVYCATSKDVLESSGKYFADCCDDEKSLAKSLVYDEALQDALWKKSLELVKNSMQY